MNGTKLIEARLRKGWSQEKMAEMLEVGLATVQRWEHGESEPRGYNRQRLCEVLGLTPEEILGIEITIPAELPVASLQSASMKALQTFIKQDLTMRLWSLASQSHRTYQDVHGAMVRIFKDHETMNSKNHHMTRRKALLRLVTLPLATLGLATFAGEESLPPSTMKEVLMQCTVSIAACWELKKSAEQGDLVIAFNGVSTYLPTLQRIVKDSSPYRQQAAGLVTQCLLLKAILAYHIDGLANAMSYAQQAISYSKEARDLSLQLRALELLTVVYAYSKRNQQALQTIEQAVPLLKQKNVPLSPHLQALVYGQLACSSARNGLDGIAYLDQAGKFLAEPDPEAPVYADYEQGYLLLDAGIIYYQQGDNTKALQALSQLVDPETLTLKVPWAEIGRIEAINYITMASLKSKDRNMEQTIHFWTEGIQASKALHSEQRFNEALITYEIMQVLWPGEKRIQELRDLTWHW